MKRAGGAILLVTLSLLSACDGADNGESSSDGPVPQATSQLDQPAAEAATELLDNFREGPDLPENWPVDVVAIPEGGTPVASLANSTLPGYGEASAVFYSVGAGQSGEQIADFFEQELPARGWTVLDRVDQNGYSEVSVQGHGYLGIFGAGEIPASPALKSGKVMDVQVVLAKLSG